MQTSPVVAVDWLKTAIESAAPSPAGWWLFVHPDQEGLALLAAATVDAEIHVRARPYVNWGEASLIPLTPPPAWIPLAGYRLNL